MAVSRYRLDHHKTELDLVKSFCASVQAARSVAPRAAGEIAARCRRRRRTDMTMPRSAPNSSKGAGILFSNFRDDDRIIKFRDFYAHDPFLSRKGSKRATDQRQVSTG